MLKAAGPTKDGGQMIILGLSQVNIQRLQNEEPIVVDCTPFGLPDLKIMIFAGDTEETMKQAIIDTGIRLPV